VSNTSKHCCCDTTALIRKIPEIFKGLGLSQQCCLLGAKVGACWYTTGIEGQLIDDMTNDGKVYI
jgi:hypothetical protein